MKFSHRHGYDPEFTNKTVRDDAPKWVRKLYFKKVLERLVYDVMSPIPQNRPLPVYDVINEILAMDDEAPDEYYLNTTPAEDFLLNLVMTIPWYRFYDAVEAVAEKIIHVDNDDSLTWGKQKNESFSFSAYRQRVNEIFSDYNVDWKMNETGQLELPLPPFLEEKVKSTEERLADQFAPARMHFRKARAFALGSHRDAENSIKESISAIESVCKTFYPEASTLGDALKMMKKDGSISPMLITVIEKFYAYANAEPAVRHGSNKDSAVLEYDAELALHFAAAFIRTLIVRRKETNS
ncbi:AbiJ-NTD4 domain-containing protein [Pantoea agglomerans]|uniref:AbiJ-NTD4 domain-containing protein n=1 Tax=Enterobacter agglomerans TaxID=549 RepID=UPI003C7B3941